MPGGASPRSVRPFAALHAWLGTPARLAAVARARRDAAAPPAGRLAPAPGSSRPPVASARVVASHATRDRPRTAPPVPLSHHELLALSEPFLRRGRRPDLSAVDRVAARIVFDDVVRPPPAGVGVALVESLRLERAGPGRWRLVRELRRDDGLSATLHAEGEAPGELLARIDAVDPAAQFVEREGFAIAVSHRVDPPREPDAPPPPPVPVRATARVGGVSLEMAAPSAAGTSGRIDVLGPPGARLALPDDLFAVLGWDWSFLQSDARGCHATVRLEGHGPVRARDAVRRFERAAAHVARALAETPGRFDERLRAARWLASVRRALPSLVWAGLAADAVLAPQLRAAGEPWPLVAIAAPNLDL